jgi:ABC-type sugar transport system ATPase subunit
VVSSVPGNNFPLPRKDDLSLIVERPVLEALEDKVGTYLPLLTGKSSLVSAEDIHNPVFAPPGIHAAAIETKVDVTELMGNEIFLYLLSGKNNFVARVDPRTRFQIGEKVQVILNMDNMHVFDPAADAENPPAVR